MYRKGKEKLAARILSPNGNADKFPGLEAVSQSLIDLEEPAAAPATAATKAPVVDAAETPASTEQEKFEEASEKAAEPAKEESPKDA
ncbi:unnamed protein product [Ambrosiozyma monospora]|uniref:Unnamed protein product n=1 Tax=Ambrosiozyma monospora TaxID=43982 RepID=A0A9W7DLU0_AMBMO|nr:unnamed protein product [Ambrosiozyma monospora]